MIRLATVAVCCLVCVSLRAETFTISGQATQPDGAVAKEATVSLVHIRLPIDEHPTTITDSEGRFEFSDVVADYVTYLGLRIVSHDGQTCGVVSSKAWTAQAGKVLVDVQLEESWNFYLKVVDDVGMPIESAVAMVELLDYEALVSQTNAQGRADFVLPRSQQVKAVAAFKENTGFHFHVYQLSQIRGDGPSKAPLRFPDETAEVLKLRGARQVEVQVMDAQGQPIVDARVVPGVFVSSSEPGSFSPRRYVAEQKTDAEGKVVFNWMPKNLTSVFFSVMAGPDFVHEFESRSLNKDPVVYKLERSAKIRGRVIDSDGYGKAGVRVAANGATTKSEFNADAVTDRDGRYELKVKPNAVYIVGVVDASFVSTAQDGIVVPRGKDIEAIDFRLQDAMVLKGQMRDVVTLMPVPDQEVRLLTKGRAAKAEEISSLDAAEKLRGREPYLFTKTKTDADGRYTFFTTPGKYSIQYMDQDKPVVVAGEQPVTLDLPAKVKKLDDFSGSVVDKTTGKAVVGANVYETNHGATWQATTDERGEFTVPRALEGTFVIAYTLGYKVAGIAHVPGGQSEVVIECQPAGIVTGKLETADGQPIANRQLECRLQMQVAAPPFALLLSKRVETNEQGEFTFKSLIAEQQYFLLMDTRPGVQKELAKFKPEANKQIDLGTIKD